MWVQPLETGDVLIGASHFGVFLAGEIIAFTSKPKGAQVEVHRGLGTVECRKTVMAVHAPISFILLAGNESAEEAPACLNHDPYGAGWMVRVEATRWAEESVRLLDGAAYRAHILSLEPEARFA